MTSINDIFGDIEDEDENLTQEDDSDLSSIFDTLDDEPSTGIAVQPEDVLDFDRVRELTPVEQKFVYRVYRAFAGNERSRKERARQNLLAYGVLNRRDAIERRRKLALLADSPD